jgi:hypothetical protein
MEKVIRDGMVAVLYSPGFGAGWYSWHGIKELLFHPEIVRLVEDGQRDQITQELCLKLMNMAQGDYICVLGADQLKIQWLPVDTAFKVDEYDGSESIETVEGLNLIA